MLKKAVLEALLFVAKLNVGLWIFYFLIRYGLKLQASGTSLLFLYLAINTCVIMAFGHMIWTSHQRSKNIESQKLLSDSESQSIH